MLSLDSQRFADQLFDQNQVWANDSGPALFKWRYTPQNTDEPSSATIRCYYEQDVGANVNKINVIIRAEGQNPVPQNTPRLGNRVNGYVDSNDPTIFGFIITKVSKSDPKKYECTAAFKKQSGMADFEPSQPLSLEVVGNTVRLLFCLYFKKSVYLFKFECFFFLKLLCLNCIIDYFGVYTQQELVR